LQLFIFTKKHQPQYKWSLASLFPAENKGLRTAGRQSQGCCGRSGVAHPASHSIYDGHIAMNTAVIERKSH
jgi:hypothetical protein